MPGYYRTYGIFQVNNKTVLKKVILGQIHPLLLIKAPLFCATRYAEDQVVTRIYQRISYCEFVDICI